MVMARQTLARVFARRMEDGGLTEERTVEIGLLWLRGNFARIYRL